VKRVLVPLAPGFEEIEAITIIDVLRRAGITVEVAGTEPGPITGSHGITVTPDRPLAGADAGTYDLVALPGGMPGTLHLREHADVRRIVRELASRGRYTTAICAAPTVLAAAGVTAGRAVTSHPSVAAELAQAGITYRTDAVVAERVRVSAALCDAGFTLPPSQANFVWLPLGPRTRDFVEQAANARIVVRPYGTDGVRVTIGAPEENDTLLRFATGWI